MVHKEAENIDISNIPELLRLAEEVKDTKEPKVLRRDGEELAVLVPAKHRSRRTKTKSDLDASGPLLAVGKTWTLINLSLISMKAASYPLVPSLNYELPDR